MKIYYAYSKSEDVSEHAFTDCLDCLPCEAIYVKSFECDPLTLLNLVERYAHQNPDLISVDLLGRVREWQDV